MNYASRSRVHLFWLLISLTIVFAPRLDAAEVADWAGATRITDSIAPKILAPLSDEAVATNGRPKLSVLPSEEAIALLAVAGLVGAHLAAVFAGRSPSTLEPQTSGSLIPSRGPPTRS